jgi:ergothioneine biosynthesis protein EgtB
MTPTSAVESRLSAPKAPAELLSPDRLLQRFLTVRQLTLAWSRLLSEEDQMVQSCSEASPVKWHLAHTAWFFETFILRPYDPNYIPLNPDFLWLFNSYYNLVSDQPEKSLRASFSRPSLQQVLDYRAYVDEAVTRLLSTPGSLSHDALATIDIGLHHEQQHQELIATDIKHAYFTNPLHPGLRPFDHSLNATASEDSSPGWLSFNPGLISIGHAGEDFAFDNERPQHPYFIGEISLARRLVSCRDYLAFIEDGSYARNTLWLSDGWDAIHANNWQAPLYWRRTSDHWEIFTLHGFVPLAALGDTPVCHLSYYEADAYAHWAGARLPSEFEWEAAASSEPFAATGLDLATLQHGTLHPSQLEPFHGSVWQWTHSAYSPYPGYRPLPGALGEYNGKFMSGQMVLRGGSIVTPADHIRPTYRNFFHPPTRWQFSGIRLAQSPS